MTPSLPETLTQATGMAQLDSPLNLQVKGCCTSSVTTTTFRIDETQSRPIPGSFSFPNLRHDNPRLSQETGGRMLLGESRIENGNSP